MFIVQDSNILFLGPYKVVNEYNFMASRENVIVNKKDIKTISVTKDIATLSLSKEIKIVVVTSNDII